MSVVVFVTTVSVTSGKVSVFPFDGWILAIIGVVNVLFVKVSVVVFVTTVSVTSGNVSVLPLDGWILAITGVVNVLFVSVSVVCKPTNVSADWGNDKVNLLSVISLSVIIILPSIPVCKLQL